MRRFVGQGGAYVDAGEALRDGPLDEEPIAQDLHDCLAPPGEIRRHPRSLARAQGLERGAKQEAGAERGGITRTLR
ncbi:hypothetical protein GCM10027586_00180 [Kineococcus gypseus]